MKKTIAALLGALVLCAIFSGCAQKSDVDTSALEKSYASAEADQRATLDSALALIREQKYAEASAPLQKLLAGAKVTPEQRSAVQDVISQVTAKLSEKAKDLTKDAGKKAGDLLKGTGFGK